MDLLLKFMRMGVSGQVDPNSFVLFTNAGRGGPAGDTFPVALVSVS